MTSTSLVLEIPSHHVTVMIYTPLQEFSIQLQSYCLASSSSSSSSHPYIVIIVVLARTIVILAVRCVRIRRGVFAIIVGLINCKRDKSVVTPFPNASGYAVSQPRSMNSVLQPTSSPNSKYGDGCPYVLVIDQHKSLRGPPPINPLHFKTAVSNACLLY